MVTGRPVLSFVHDRGLATSTLAMDLDGVMPVPVVGTFEELMTGLTAVFEEPTEAQQRRYERIRRLLFDRVDDQSARRVASTIRRAYVEEPA
jgi:hypothetical protein